MPNPLPPFSPLAQSLVIGATYTHYKNLLYKVLSVARHSETLEELVVYQALYGERGIWVRPVAMFLETVIVNNVPTPRFKLLTHSSNS